MTVSHSQAIAAVPLSPHLDFTGFDRSDLSREEAIRSLESRDEALSLIVNISDPGRKFSWLVLHRYYELCSVNGKIPDWERHEADWARHHIDREPLYRMTAIANVICHLFSKYTALLGHIVHEEDAEIAALRARAAKLERENHRLCAARPARSAHQAIMEEVEFVLAGRI